MFYYFGYGSNLSVTSLRAKGVDPLSSEPAILRGWQLTFDIPDFFPIEGGTGNIRPQAGGVVHGVLHACRDADLETLDALEALGVSYERAEFSVVTYGGRRLRAYVYVGIAARVGGEGLPSARYRNILVNGARDMRLEPAYVEWLEARPVRERPECEPFDVPDDLPQRTVDELSLHLDWVGLHGAVFETTGADPRLDYLCELLGGRDVTLLFLKRMDTSTGAESFRDVRNGRLDAKQRRYLNAYLHEFAREFRLVGRLDYVPSPSTAPPPPGSQWGDTQRPAPLSSGHRRSTPGTDRHRRLPEQVPAASVLRRAEDTYLAVGNENLGFLSESWGFMPREPPRQSLAKSHAAWDQAAGDLTDMYRTLTVRRRLDALPVLDAGVEHLSDGDLLRAASVLAMLSHSYWYSHTRPPEELPEALSRPWATVRERLGRGPEPVLSYIDLIVYNWRLVDPDLPDPMRVENLRLLTPTVDNAEERHFYLTQTEILARCAPVVSAAISAQAAAMVDDREAVEAELMTVIACLRQVVRESLLKIDPNPAGATHVDPVVWAKTVAPFAVPFVEGVLGPSGTSSPLFNFLDVFLGRKSFDSFLGEEIRSLRNSYPPLWRELLVALSKVDVGAYVRETEDANLGGLWRETIDAYAGESGFLGRHRMKVYGYLELAFKVGRSVTIGGFSGLFDDRTWDQVDSELEASRRERLAILPRACHHARVAKVRSGDGVVPEGVAHVTLDVTGTGIHYEAGDRCGVLPESDPELVARTLRALGATGSEPVALTPEWLAAVALRHGYEGRETLTSAEVLRFGQIRPVVPRVAEALHAHSQDALLKTRMWGQESHHWELWDLLEHLQRGGYDPAHLVASSADGPGDALCRVVPPEVFRFYSISSVMSRASMAEASEIELTVRQIAYRTEGMEGVADRERRGTASSFLGRSAGREEPISIIVRHPARFDLPEDPRAPVVMIAGGTGISPFRGFLVERARARDAGPAFVFLGLRSREHLRPYEEELGRCLAGGRTALHVAFSRDDVEAVWEPGEGAGRFVYRPAPRRRVPDVLLQGRTARELWALVQPTDETNAAHVFVCGRAAFADAVIDGFRSIFRRFSPGTDEERDAFASDTLTRLTGTGRLKLEIFSGGAGPSAESRAPIDVSEIVRHNHPDRGLWLVIEGLVYDLTEFVRNHPGGSRVLEGYAGLDATQGYHRSHEGRSEIEAIREIYEIGAVRRLDLGDEVLSAIGPSGATTTTLLALHRAWVRLAYLVVEMENALRNDQALQSSQTTRDEPLHPRSALRLERALETHERFVESYLTPLSRHRIPSLWERMNAVLEGGEPSWMRERLTRIAAGRDAGYAIAARESVRGAVAGLSSLPDPEMIGRLERTFAALEARDARFLSELKSALRDGLQVFERLEKGTLVLGADQLLTSCRRMADVVAGYHEGTGRVLRQHGWEGAGAEGVSQAVEEPSEDPEAGALETLHSSPLWEMSVHPDRDYVVLRRTPVPVDTIEQLQAENEQVLACMLPEHRALGIVVDMRQAQPRNDAAFENAMRRVRVAVDECYARVAVLLESSVGVLQVNRLSRAEGSAQFATRSEGSAIKFAMGTG